MRLRPNYRNRCDQALVHELVEIKNIVSEHIKKKMRGTQARFWEIFVSQTELEDG